MQEEEHPEEEQGEDEQSSTKAAAAEKPKRRREGTMNKNFKFPPPADAAAPPPVPDLPKSTQKSVDQDQRSSIEAADPQKKDHEEDGMTSVGVVAPSSVEVPAPAPVEKERAMSGGGSDELEELGETEEISLN